MKRVDGEYEETTTQPQLSARYYEVRLPEGDAAMEFEGEATVAQVGTECHSGRFCWWSGNGDSIDTTLEREFDLSGVESAMLEFWMWYEIEEDWDYAFVSVSTDGGEMWTTLDGEHTTREDPLGANYGAGITGISGSNRGGGKSAEWVRERMDLSEYAGAGGESVLVRFEYITDEGVNLDGIVIDDIAVAELGFADDVETNGDWQANGFRRIDNVLPQAFVLRLIEFGKRRRRVGERAAGRFVQHRGIRGAAGLRGAGGCADDAYDLSAGGDTRCGLRRGSDRTGVSRSCAAVPCDALHARGGYRLFGDSGLHCGGGHAPRAVRVHGVPVRGAVRGAGCVHAADIPRSVLPQGPARRDSAAGGAAHDAADTDRLPQLRFLFMVHRVHRPGGDDGNLRRLDVHHGAVRGLDVQVGAAIRAHVGGAGRLHAHWLRGICARHLEPEGGHLRLRTGRSASD